MNYIDAIREYEKMPFHGHLSDITPAQVRIILQKENLTVEDLPVLLSEPAQEYLELMARRAEEITRRYFGYSVFLFTPLYISNHCQNRCPYCSFAATNTIQRRQLSFEDVEAEARAIGATGIRHVLVLTGESPRYTGFDYIRESLSIIGDHFSAVGIEMYPMQEEQYARLIEGNLIDSLTIYQETYNEKLYGTLHRGGPKEDYLFRLEAPERACRSRIRAVTIGALLGLDDFRREALCLALHASYLQKHYPEVELSFSFPRLRPQQAGYIPPHPVIDRQLVQLIIAFRLLFPFAGITLSTRESQRLRNSIIPLGITKVSAGVSTKVGGYGDSPSTAQFEIADERSVAQMRQDLSALGFQPVLHDWNRAFFTGKK